MQSNQPVKEKVVVVAVDLKEKDSGWSPSDVLKEMEELVLTSGGEVVDSIISRVTKPTARYLLSEGKVTEIADLCQLRQANTVVLSCDLKGSQQRNLEEAFKVKTVDRTQIILDIFARHAKSNEGKMQVELAQLEYLLPRLVGKGIEMSRLGGGIGTLGPGETKLEIDRRRIADRITRLRRELKTIVSSRQVKRKQRDVNSVPSVTLVGYTNAGKSTLLNQLTGAGQVTHDGLFTTLDSLSRQFTLPNRQRIVLSDTVGFMHDLPHGLIESFKATLEEVVDADLLLHVIDVSHPNFKSLYEAVVKVLEEIEADDKQTVIVLNKIDKVADPGMLEQLRKSFDHGVCISAKFGTNMDTLLAEITHLLSSMYVEINVDVPIKRMDLVNLAHEEGEVYSIKYYEDHINIRASVPSHLAGKFQTR